MGELRAAAERLRRYGHGDTRVYEKPLEPHETDRDRLERDRAYLVSAYLAEHKADDGDAPSPEWLRSVGFVDGEGHLVAISPARRDGEGLIVRRLSSGEWNAEDGFSAILLPEPMTRGAVRRLCLALGIPLGIPLTEPA